MYPVNCCVMDTTLVHESCRADYNFVCLFHPWTRRDIILYREEEGGKVTEKVYNAVSIRGLPPIRLVFMGNEHYDCVYQRGWCKRAGFCQGTHRHTYIHTYVCTNVLGLSGVHCSEG